MPIPGPGITLPATLPATLPPETIGGSMVVTNAGTAPTERWVARIDAGPTGCTDPRIRHPASKRLMAFPGLVLGPNEYLILDGMRKDVLLNGESSRYSALDGRWFSLDPGDNDVRFYSPSPQVGPTVIFTWRPAWW